MRARRPIPQVGCMSMFFDLFFKDGTLARLFFWITLYVITSTPSFLKDIGSRLPPPSLPYRDGPAGVSVRKLSLLLSINYFFP